MFDWFKTKHTVIEKPKLETVKCPYCFCELDKAPVRNKKCKSCKQIIFVRIDHSLNKKLFLIEKDAILLDEKDQKQEWKEMHAFYKKELERYKKDGLVTKVEILTAGDTSCEYCKELSGKLFDINEALEKRPLPCKECIHKIKSSDTTGWCRCCYGPHVE